MPKLKVLSGTELVAIFQTLGFSMTSQKGSHIKLARIAGTERQILTVPNHKELDRGTIHAIYRQASRYINESELKKYFYTE